MESEIFGSRFIRPRLILDSGHVYLCLDLVWKVKYLAGVLLDLDLSGFWTFYLFLDLVWKVKYLAAVLLDLDFFWILKIFIFV